MTVDARSRYGSVAIILHWLIAIGVLLNIPLGLYFVSLPHSDANRFLFTQTHKSIGLTVLVLSLLRVAWRLVNPIPPLPTSMSPFLRFVARATQFLLYVLIVAIPLSGWALVSASPLGLPTLYFGQFVWPHIAYLADLTRAQKIPLDREIATIHILLAWSAIVLIPLHITGALYHQFIRRDDVLARMFPLIGRKSETA